MNSNHAGGKERMPVSGRQGHVLKQLREALDLKQEEVACRAGLSVVALSRMENGLTCSAVDNYERVADALGVDYEVVVSLASALARRDDYVLTNSEVSLALLGRRL